MPEIEIKKNNNTVTESIQNENSLKHISLHEFIVPRCI